MAVTVVAVAVGLAVPAAPTLLEVRRRGGPIELASVEAAHDQVRRSLGGRRDDGEEGEEGQEEEERAREGRHLGERDSFFGGFKGGVPGWSTRPRGGLKE